MGHEGMRASLVSREVSCDSVETVVFAERLDGFVGMAGCDKWMPAMLMAVGPSRSAERARLQRLDPARRARRRGDRHHSVFEAVGACAAGTISEEELGEIERSACPGEGACGGMFTANTMSSIGEALGMSLPGRRHRRRSTAAATDDARARRARRWCGCCELGITPAADHDQAGVRERDRPDVGPRRLHQRGAPPARHRQRGRRQLHLDDFNRIAARVPHIADMKPGGKFHMSDLDRVGGVPVVLRHLLDAGLIARRRAHGDRQDDGREPRRARPARAGRGRGPPARRADPPRGRHQHPHRLAGTEGRGGEGRRADQGPAAVPGAGAGVRRRGRGDGRDPGRRRSCPGRCS